MDGHRGEDRCRAGACERRDFSKRELFKCVCSGRKAAGVKGVLSEGGVPQLSEPLRFKLTWAEISVSLWSDEELLLRSSCS